MWSKRLIVLFLFLPGLLGAQPLGSLLLTQGTLRLNGQSAQTGDLLLGDWSLKAPEGAAAGILLSQGGLMLFQGPGLLEASAAGGLALKTGQLWVQSPKAPALNLPFVRLEPAQGEFLLHQGPQTLRLQAINRPRGLLFKEQRLSLEPGNQITLNAQTQRPLLHITRIPAQVQLKLPQGISLLMPGLGALDFAVEAKLTGPGPYPSGSFKGLALSDSARLRPLSNPLLLPPQEGLIPVQLTSAGATQLTVLLAPQGEFPGAVGSLTLEGYQQPGQRRLELRTSQGNLHLQLRKKPN